MYNFCLHQFESFSFATLISSPTSHTVNFLLLLVCVSSENDSFLKHTKAFSSSYPVFFPAPCCFPLALSPLLFPHSSLFLPLISLLPFFLLWSFSVLSLHPSCHTDWGAPQSIWPARGCAELDTDTQMPTPLSARMNTVLHLGSHVIWEVCINCTQPCIQWATPVCCVGFFLKQDQDKQHQHVAGASSTELS